VLQVVNSSLTGLIEKIHKQKVAGPCKLKVVVFSFYTIIVYR